jgi:hypothetical protein
MDRKNIGKVIIEPFLNAKVEKVKKVSERSSRCRVSLIVSAFDFRSERIVRVGIMTTVIQAQRQVQTMEARPKTRMTNPRVHHRSLEHRCVLIMFTYFLMI